MEVIKKESGDILIEMSLDEFHSKYFVGCLVNYSNTDKKQKVGILVSGHVPDMQHCVIRKFKEEHIKQLKEVFEKYESGFTSPHKENYY